MAKPICAIYISAEVLGMVNKDIWEACRGLLEQYELMMPDYYTFVLPDFRADKSIPVMDFKVFHVKDFSEVQYDELKSIIESKLTAVVNIKR